MTPITRATIDDLMKTAEKATPGPWKATGRYIGTLNHASFIGECRDINGNWSDEGMASENGIYIAAANPDLILALCRDWMEKNEALKLFSDELLSLPSDLENSEGLCQNEVYLTVGDLRRARTAYTGEK